MTHIRAKKSLGQNFLKSKKALSAMAEAGNVQAGDLVVEIGPGKGALTRVLLETGAKVLAFEKDHRLIELLKTEFAEYAQKGLFELHEQDVLDIEIGDFVQGNYKLIANIPYYITGEITRKFLSGTRKPNVMVVLVQKEVAERIVDSKESILSLSVKVFGTPKKVMTVKKEFFSPEPKVDSAIIAISDIQNRFATPEEEARFFMLIKKAFGQKRKKMNSTLKEFKDEIADWEVVKEKRPETLGVEEWLRIAKPK